MAPRKSKAKSTGNVSAVDESIRLRQLDPRVEQPPKLFILPDAALSPQTRFISLLDPTRQCLNRYLYCPNTGFYQLTKIGPSSSPIRSCLIVGQIDSPGSTRSATSSDPHLTQGYVLEDAGVYVATIIDPLFFLTPLVTPGLLTQGRQRPTMARTADDHLDSIASTSKHMARLLRRPKVRQLLAGRLEHICETVDSFGEEAYRPDPLFLLEVLFDKAKSMETKAWPPSLEYHVRRQLEVPITAQPNESAQSVTEGSNEQDPGTDTQPGEAGDSAGRMNAATVPPAVADTEGMASSLRLRVALQFIMAMYLPPELRKYLESVLASNRLYDFSALDEHLAYLQKMRTEAQALRTLSDNISRKRSDIDDDEASEMRETKRRKKEDEEKRRKAESRATKQLKKVDTAGMKKLSSFFTKKTE